MSVILVIDDSPAVATALEVLFSLHDISTLRAESPEAGLAILDGNAVDLVIQDMNFSADTTSGEEGVALFGAIRAAHPHVPVILLTAWTHLEAAVDLVKAGAADYLAKPWDDRKLLATVGNLIELGRKSRTLARIQQDGERRQSALAERFDLRGMVFADAATERVVELACRVARADVAVLITGPNGAGKDKIAEIIQASSSVKDGPFVTLNCGALPSELIEGELFGVEAGAYTGAGKARQGKFEAADGGTLFLDEIGNLPPSGQMKLLRVLETGRFQRLGSNLERQVRVRVLSATNADLPALIREGRFREDLYYRLNVIEIELPPLCDRKDDILPLAEHFLCAGPGSSPKAPGHPWRGTGDEKVLTQSARDALVAHPWPGNVRELKNTMQRAALLTTGGDIDVADLGLPPASSQRKGRIDRAAIEEALARAGGVIAQAAAELGMSRPTLYRWMDKLGIERP
ncbi:MAG TPA: sigma-54 dependent transcriptional regulator [Kofleriaceae bacterium]|nr:sigma-54 dependent transcriptional regulator [Kofleriaceae bacterium]